MDSYGTIMNGKKPKTCFRKTIIKTPSDIKLTVQKTFQN